MNNKRKDFEVQEESGKTVKLSVRSPIHEDYDGAERIYAEKVSSLVRQGKGKRLLLRSEINTFLKDAGVWTETDEKKIADLNKEVDTLLSKVRKGGVKASEGRELCIQVMDKRKEIVQVMKKRQIFDDTTIESMAEQEKMDYLIYSCTVYADSGSNYWDSAEDMKNDKLSNAYAQATVCAYSVILNIDSQFEKNLPENKWLKKYNFVDDDLNYTDRKTGNKVDRSGQPVEILQKDMEKRIENLNGDIQEEQPFIDDETGQPITGLKVESDTKEKDIAISTEEKKEEVVETAVV